MYHSITTTTPLWHYPTLSGPGGQLISLNAVMSGNLQAGDWTFLYNFQGVYPGENVLDMTSATHSPASFILSIPEPASMTLVLLTGAMLARQRRTA